MKDPIAPLRVVATNDHFVAVSDDLDMSPAQLEEYRASREPEMVKEREGRKATWFVVKRLPAIATPMLKGMAPATREMCAFLMACHLVETPDGPLEPNHRTLSNGAGGTRMASDDWYNEVATRWGVETCAEVGRVAYQWASLPEKARGFFT